MEIDGQSPKINLRVDWHGWYAERIYIELLNTDLKHSVELILLSILDGFLF